MMIFRLAIAMAALAAFVVAIPAADSYADAVDAIVNAKSREERLAVLKGKSDEFIEDVLAILFKVEGQLIDRGEFGEAERVHEWTEEASELPSDPDRRELCQLLCLLGKGRNAQAEEKFDEAAAVYKVLQAKLAKKKGAEFRAFELGLLCNLGAAQSMQGDYLGGVKTLKEAKAGLAGQSDLARGVLEASILGNLGQLYSEVGDFASAELELKESLRLAEKTKDLGTAMNAKLNLARLDLERGRCREAIRSYESLLKECRKLGVKPKEGKIINNLGLALMESGRFSDAIVQFEDARKQAVQLKQRRAQALALFNLAVVYYKLEKEEDAEHYNLQALKLFREVGDMVGVARCLRLVASELKAEQREQAEKLMLECLELIKKSGSKVQLAQISMELGILYELSGQTEKALEQYGTSRRAYKDLGDPMRSLLTRIKLACVRLPDKQTLLVDLDELKRMKNEVERLDDPRVTSNYYDTLGRYEYFQGSPQSAARYFRTAIDAEARWVSGIEDPELAVGYRSRSHHYGYLVAAELRCGKPEFAFQASEEARGRILNRALQRGGLSIQREMTAAEQAEEERLRGKVARVSHENESVRRFAAADPQAPERLKKQLAEAAAEYEAFRRRLYTTHPNLRIHRGDLPPVSLNDIQQEVFARDPDLAIVTYLMGDSELLISTIVAGENPDGPARLAIHSFKVEENKLAAACKLFHDACQSSVAGRPEAEELWKWLITPIEKEIAGKKHLLIIPASPLLSLPFQALHPDEGPYLLETYAISYAPSVSAFLEMRRRGTLLRAQAGAERPVLAVGGVKFTRGLRELPASGPEAETVAKTYGTRSRLLLGEKATRGDISKEAPSARVLHFATHGLVNSARPLFSALGTTPADDADDGRLYAHDVMNLSLTAEVAVLSACETARGKEYRGEGTLGLAWAFFVAGASSVVVSQWSVADNATEELMTIFHQRMQAGNDPSRAESLRQAQLTLLKNRKTRHPAYWAPFVYMGDYRR